MATSSAGSTRSLENDDYSHEHDTSPMSISDMYQHGMELYKEKRFDDAIRVFTALVHEDSKNFEAYQARGQCHLELHNYSKAITDLRRATELHPNASNDNQRSIAHYYTHLFAKLETDGSATSHTRHAGMETLSMVGWKHYNRALSAYYLSQFDKAIDDFSAVLEEVPTFSAGFRCRGTAYLHIGKFTHAIEDLLESSRLERSSTTYYNLGLAFGNLQQFESAVKYFTHAISLNAHDSATYSNRGISYKSLKQYEAAIADFSTALSINPDSASSYDHRGQCHYELGNHTSAVEDFSNAVRLQSNAARFQRRAAVYFALGHTERAIEDLDSAISKSHSSSDLATYFYTRGRYLLDTDLVQAEIDFGRSMTHAPASTPAIYSRSAARYSLKDYSGAKADRELATLLDGTDQLHSKFVLQFPIF
jgi:tetratricopeptide (TPR) repeat protein